MENTCSNSFVITIHNEPIFMTMENRVDELTKFPPSGNVLYIISRDQRLHENHSILLSYSLSNQLKSQLFLGIEIDKIKMNQLQKAFISQGLREMEKECRKYNLHFYSIKDLESFIEQNEIGSIVLDYNPMREYLKRQDEIKNICKNRKISLFVCDSHNIVPCKLLKTYKRTPMSVRMDLFNHWNTYLKEYDKIEPHKYNIKDNNSKVGLSCISIQEECDNLDKETAENNDLIKKCEFKGGYTKGMKQLEIFFKERFSSYNTGRNNPELNLLSDLSPYFHTGQISPLQVILLTEKKSGSENYDAFIREAFIWRETAEHFVYHEKNYDNINGALPWAKETLMYHSQDKRSKIYSFEQLEAAQTDDPLWNAAQNQLLISGKIHGYVRMYWAKTLLQWTEDPREALRIGIELNDKYSIDGNDPNGYLGVMWCICGSMDRAFAERPVLGKIRPMKSFKCPGYIQRWASKKNRLNFTSK